MKTLLKNVLSAFLALALAIQLPVNLISVANAEDDNIVKETADVTDDEDEVPNVAATNDEESGEVNEVVENEIATASDEGTGTNETYVVLNAASTTIYYNVESDYTLVSISTNIEENYTVVYTLSKDGVIEQSFAGDNYIEFDALTAGEVTITATITTESGKIYTDTIDITVKDYLDVIADTSMEDPDYSGFYFVYTVLSEEDKTIEIIDYYFDTEYYSSPFSINIPSNMNGYTVVSIGDSVFYGCGDTMKVLIPSSITNIDDAFSKYFPVRTLYVYAGSVALQYAIDNIFNYAIIDETTNSVSYDGDYVYNLMYSTVWASSYDFMDYNYGITTVSNSDIAKIKNNLASNQEILKSFGFELTVDDYDYDIVSITDLPGEIHRQGLLLC